MGYGRIGNIRPKATSAARNAYPISLDTITRSVILITNQATICR